MNIEEHFWQFVPFWRTLPNIGNVFLSADFIFQSMEWYYVYTKPFMSCIEKFFLNSDLAPTPIRV